MKNSSQTSSTQYSDNALEVKQGTNTSLHVAMRNKDDEFYTRIEDVVEEVREYKDAFRGKSVYCNCDDPDWSSFTKFFGTHFEEFGLKKLVTTCFDPSGNPSKKLVMDGPGDPSVVDLSGNGDYRSEECMALLDECDIVVTNPPFSIFGEYITTLLDSGKGFLVIGNINAMTTKAVFPLYTAGKVNVGLTKPKEFNTPSGDKESVPCYWYTNLLSERKRQPLTLGLSYNPSDYPKYDNCNAIEVNQIKRIPGDYAGVMGVSTRFPEHFNPDQFEIIGITKGWGGLMTKTYGPCVRVDPDGTRTETKAGLSGAAVLAYDPVRDAGKRYYEIGGKKYRQTFPRILIRNKNPRR